MTQREVIKFLNVIERLKRNTRHCQTDNGRQESVADHSWRTAVMAMLVGDNFPEVDINKVVQMCLIHDLGEAITGDVPSFYKTDEHRYAEQQAVNTLLSMLDAGVKTKFTQLFEEMMKLDTPESKLFKALDNMEAVVAHNESPLESWLPLEYTENLRYGEKNVAWSDWLVKFKEEVNKDSMDKINEVKLTVTTHNLGALKDYRFVVIFARYKQRWLYCKAKSRDVYETAGGHIEEGETTLQAAKREFYEETGALQYDITPAFDYSVHNGDTNSNGQVFFADVKVLGDIPESEMEKTKLFDSIPPQMRLPQILPILYNSMQEWLNLQSSKDEIWDLYDAKRRPTGETHRRADPIPEGRYHLSVHVWIQNQKGEFLITKRAPNKGFPNMWEHTGGSATTGDDSITAAIREVKEETGLTVNPENGSCIISYMTTNCHCDVWLFKEQFDLSKVVLQPFETVDARSATKDEILRMTKSGEFVVCGYLDLLFNVAD